MKITIYQNREVYKEESKIGNDSENKVETLEFEFPEEYRDFTKYIEFQIKGEKYVDLIEDNKYVITREVAKYGKIKTQVVLKKNTENDVMIFKSDVFTLTVSNSINATENLVHTVGIDLIEKIVTKNNEQDARLDALEVDNTNNKENISNLQNDNTTNKSDIKSLQDDNEVNKTDISNIKQEQTTQNTNISNLQADNTSNKSKIEALEDKNTEQDTNIQKNTDDIAEINAKNTTQDSLIEQLQAENTKLKKEINSMQIPGEATGNPIHLTDSSNMECEIVPIGGAEQETGDVTDEEGNVIGAMPSPDYPSEIVTVGQNVNIFNILDYTATFKVTGEARIFDSNNFRVIAKYSTNSNCMTMFRTIDLTNYAGKTLTIQAIVKSNTDTNKAFIVLRQNNYDYSGTKSNELYDESQNTTDGVITLKYKVVDTINDNNRYLFIGFYATRGNNCNTGDYVDYKVKMVEGTEVGRYSPYGQGSVEIKVDNGLETTDTNYQSYTKVLPIQKEFVKIGDVEDTFVKVEGKWYEKHAIGKGKYNPNNIGVNSIGNLRIKATLWGYDNKKDCNVLCKYFKNRYARWDDGNEINNVIYGWSDNGSIGINFDKNKFSTIEDFKKWASEVGLEFYFVKQQPELIPCTAEQSAILNSFYTYKGITNVSVDGIATLKVNYKKDLETIINNLSATSVAE